MNAGEALIAIDPQACLEAVGDAGLPSSTSGQSDGGTVHLFSSDAEPLDRQLSGADNKHVPAVAGMDSMQGSQSIRTEMLRAMQERTAFEGAR